MKQIDEWQGTQAAEVHTSFRSADRTNSTILGIRQVVRHQVLVLAFGGSNPSSPAKIGLNWRLSPERVAFSLVARSADQMFSGGEKEIWAAVGCAFWDFRIRFEPKISLASVFLPFRSALCAV